MRPNTRLMFYLLLSLVVALAACGGGPGPSTPESGQIEGLDILYDQDAPTTTPSPAPTPIGTPDPDEPLTFDLVMLERQGGPGNTFLTVVVLGNGAVLVDEELRGGVAPEVVTDLDAQLDAMGFYRLDERYGPLAPRSGTYTYTLTMERNGRSYSLVTLDGYVPDSLRQLIDSLLALDPVLPAPPPTHDPALPSPTPNTGS